MLNDHEQRIWVDTVRLYGLEAAEPLPADGRAARLPARYADGVEDVPAVVVVAAWLAVMLVIFGAVGAGLALGVGAWLGWGLRRHRQRMDDRPPGPGRVDVAEPW